MTPLSRLRMTTVADRGRPSGSKSGQLLTARVSGDALRQATADERKVNDCQPSKR
jgi:hypothetical protein